MSIAESSCKLHFICGDFNYSSIDYENVCLTSSNPSAQAFIETAQDLFMLQHIVKPTRYRGDDTPIVSIWYLLKIMVGLGNSDHVCIAFDLVLPSSHVIDSPIDTMYMVLTSTA